MTDVHERVGPVARLCPQEAPGEAAHVVVADEEARRAPSRGARRASAAKAMFMPAFFEGWRSVERSA